MKLEGPFKKISEYLSREELISSFFLVLFVILTFVGLFVSPHLTQLNVREGDIALKNIYAPYDFTYLWGVDEESTEKARVEAVNAVPLWMDRDVGSEEQIKDALDNFFDIVEEEQLRDAPIAERVSALKDLTGTDLSDREIRTILEYPNPGKLRKRSVDILQNIFLVGYIKEADLAYLKSRGEEEVTVYSGATETTMDRETSDLLDDRGVEGLVTELAAKDFPKDRRIRTALTSLLTGFSSANLVPDEQRTEQLKEKAASGTAPIHHVWSVKKNELIVEKGKRINDRHIAQMSQLRRFFRPGTTPTFFMGVILLFLVMGLIAYIYTTSTRQRGMFSSPRSMAIVLLSMLVMVLMSDVIMHSAQPGIFIPMAAMGMVITLLVGFDIAFLCTVLMNITIVLIIGGRMELSFVLLAGSTVGMFAVKGARKRTTIVKAGLMAGAAKLIAISSIGLINGMELDFYLKEGSWSLASGIFSGFLVMGALPVLEHIFKTPTDISLLELSDMNQPLLKKLAMEAPGTYHHSIMVGNLAESACDAIGANSLLARVGSYYHDIGKMPKAEYFTENEMGAGSKHQNLAPSMSALIIANHVKEGVEIARQNKLNRVIIDFIKQHHGVSLIGFFYQKALERVQDGNHIKEEDFRYPGPKPQTKESAIVMLADSVEATSRSLEDPTPASIRNLVRKIINNKFIDGQLDECELTLRDMHEIADSFVRVLMGIFHTRLKYPDPPKKTLKQGQQGHRRPREEGGKGNADKGSTPKQEPKKKDQQ